MDERNLEKAMDIITMLLGGEDVGKNDESSRKLYEEYSNNPQIYDCVHKMLKRMNLVLYEYNDGLYITAGDHNPVFGYSNADIRKELGLKVNRELYLCYFIVYQIISCFYSDTSGYNFTEYIKIERIIAMVDDALGHIISNLEIFVENKTEEHSFESIALVWNELPTATEETVRAAKNSKAGYVKLVLNFLVEQKLMAQSEERYYLKDRGKALIENYFEENKGRLYQIMQEGE